MLKSLDRKLAAIHADPSCREFILADAKDADMAFGIGAPGLSPESHPGEVRFKTLEEYRQQIRAIVQQGAVDIMLMSAHTNHALTIRERIFEGSPVTPAARANDTTDVHIARGSRYAEGAAMPFRSASLDHIQCGHLDCTDQDRALGADLGLYSVTFNNDLRLDHATLERFHHFREEAERKRFRYFLEVFDPNLPDAIDPAILPAYINDMIARMLAGVAPSGRPVFLKVVYHGPKAMEELVRYDPQLVVGILGGSAGTTRDAFQMLADAQKYGAKVALYGRKINNAENQLAFVQFLRLIVDGVIGPVEAVKAYHAVLGKLGIAPKRPLEDDLKLQAVAMSYGGTSTSITVPARTEPAKAKAEGCGCPAAPSAAPAPAGACHCHGPAPVNGSANGIAVANGKPTVANGKPSANGFPSTLDGRPDFARMDVSQRLAYHRDRLGLGR